ncbi:MAG: hypothetical protein A2428_09395 [Bdellovibrionales bacterium RIFOXYC1_FULL_54_43]|nr:MAG: hypothetical protein A2428_09395 [Bdellovibrionales bacterium RIFOXYC1_FULL_54_43]
MANEQQIQTELVQKFPFLAEKFVIKRERRIFCETAYDRFLEVFGYAVDKMDFRIFSTVTGLDEGENLSFLYHLSRLDGTLLNIKTSVSKTNPVLKTVTGWFPGSALYERELVDMFGAKVEGLPDGFRYPLPDSFPKDQHPLRKDWKPEMLPEGAGSIMEEK